MNEPDAYALEESLRLKEKHGGEVVVCSAGPARVAQVLREALARGADRAIHVEDEGLGARRCLRGRGGAGGCDEGRGSSTSCSPAFSPTIRGSRRPASSWPSGSACRTRPSSWRCRSGPASAAGQARARGRLVSVGHDADAGRADDSERDQSAAIRDAQRHHGARKRKRSGRWPPLPVAARARRSSAFTCRRRRRRRRSCPARRRKPPGSWCADCAKRRG